MDEPGESEWEGSWNSQSFQGHRLTFLELKEALRGLLPTPEETGEGQTLPHRALVHRTRGLTTHLSPFLPLQPQGLPPIPHVNLRAFAHTVSPFAFPPPHNSFFHPSGPPQSLCTHCSPFPPSLLSTAAPSIPHIHPRAFAHTVFSPHNSSALLHHNYSHSLGPTEWDTSLGFSAHTAPYSPFKCF